MLFASSAFSRIHRESLSTFVGQSTKALELRPAQVPLKLQLRPSITRIYKNNLKLKINKMTWCLPPMLMYTT